MNEEDKPPSGEETQRDDAETNQAGQKRKWRPWHEREVPVRIEGKTLGNSIEIAISSKQLERTLCLQYPNAVWKEYPKENKIKLLDNITYIFTAHLPFLLKGNIRLEYNTGYPHVYSWANQCFMRYLPAYWYLYRGRRGTKVFPLLKTMLNSRACFAETKDIPPRFPETVDENIIIPFTFGKDSLLTYNLARELGLNPTLIYFNEPTEEYAAKHKKELIGAFKEKTKEAVYYLDNPLGTLREYGEGWFGWELSLTSWALLSLPFAYKKKAGYIVFSSESSCNDFFYDDENLKVTPDYEQSGQATEELSLMTQALSEGEVYITTFLQGVHDLGIIAILKNRYFSSSFKYLMSCWAETEAARDKRWCAQCSKCARLYVYLTANGIDPIKETGFVDNMLTSSKEPFYNVFGRKAAGAGWDAFGLNYAEQSLAFFLTYLRGNRDPLVRKFLKTPAFAYAKENFRGLVETYYSLHPETVTPPQWKKGVDRIFKESLQTARREIMALARSF